MEEIEVPTEHLHEAVHHEAHHSQEAWITWVALSTALLAALAAVTALLSGMNANEALIDRVTSSDTWSQFQANSIKLSNLEANADSLKMRNEQVPSWFSAKIKKYGDEKDNLSKRAKAEEESFHQRLERHEVLAHGVTMFQIAISIAAISALTKRRWFWYLGLGFGALGTAFLVYALTVIKVVELSEGNEESMGGKEGTKAPKEAKGKSKETKDAKESSGAEEGKESKNPKESKAKESKPAESQSGEDGKESKDAAKPQAGLSGPQADRLTEDAPQPLDRMRQLVLDGSRLAFRVLKVGRCPLPPAPCPALSLAA